MRFTVGLHCNSLKKTDIPARNMFLMENAGRMATQEMIQYDQSCMPEREPVQGVECQQTD